MANKGMLFFFLIFFTGQALFAQQKYWVEFRDKKGVSFDPFEYFDIRTIEKRELRGIPLAMETDLPLNEEYYDAVNAISPVLSSSRWLNAVTLRLKPEQEKEIRSLPFVRSVRPVESLRVAEKSKKSISAGTDELQLIRAQTGSMEGYLFTRAGIDGHGVRIAVLDAGFPGVDTLAEFSHLRNEGRIVDTWDFVKKRKDVYSWDSHGTEVLGCIAGVFDTLRTGLGTGAEFLLARTEVEAEVFSEEENWFAAIEWADKNGADIVNSSLGYTFNRYFPRQMDGRSTFVSRMANVAARKGLLVINAAGNDGDTDWQVIGAPADADSVLAVGGINSETGIHMDFSSFGPTFDGRIKPNVCAFADVYSAGKKGGTKKVYGTSFAAPLVTGFAACVMQMHPGWNNMKVFHELEKSGDLYPYYDYAHGYGIPQASYFLNGTEKALPTFTTTREYTFLTVRTYPHPAETDTSVKENKEEKEEVRIIASDGVKKIEINKDSLNIVYPGDNEPIQITTEKESDSPVSNYLFYHFADKDSGKIRYYAVVDMKDATKYPIDLADMHDNEILRIFYRGYTQSYSK